jgi:hypothetical protein
MNVPNRDHFPGVFAQLKEVFQPLAPPLTVINDSPGDYFVVGTPSAKYPIGEPFGAIMIKKNYVSYHLMPVYVFPDLLDGLPDRLRKRMQGKSCFNFTAIDEATADDLARLTTAGLDRYRSENMA